MTIDNITWPKKRACCTSDPLPASIYVTYINYVITLTTKYYYLQVIYLYYYYLKPHYIIMSDKPFYVREKIWYYPKIHSGIIFYKKMRLYFFVCSIDKRVYYCHGPTRRGSSLTTFLLNINIVLPLVQLIDVFNFLYFYYFTYWTHFLPVSFLVYWPHAVPIIISDILETFILSCCYCVF